MGIEIERKFLLKNDDWKALVSEKRNYRQGYFKGGDKASIRVRVDDDQARLNIKSATLGISRQEFEYQIPLDEGHTLLNDLCEKPIIEKTRYMVPIGPHLWEIDIFEGDNAGLCVAEVELSAEDEYIDLPEWIGEEVSMDVKYYNVSLVKNPYCKWPK